MDLYVVPRAGIEPAQPLFQSGTLPTELPRHMNWQIG
jgi:hypothetical protein